MDNPATGDGGGSDPLTRRARHVTMATEGAMEDLRHIGLGAEPLAVYKCLVSHPEWGVDAIASACGTTATSVRASLDQLLELGLLRPHADGFRPVNPKVGLDALVGRQLAELADRAAQLERIRLMTSFLADELKTDEHEQMTVFSGVDRVRSELELLAAECREEMCAFQPGGPLPPELIAAAKPLDDETLGRGVRIRSVYVDSAVHDASTRDYLEWLQAAGAMVRSVAALPLRLIIVDGAKAVLPLKPHNSEVGAVLVTQPGVVQALVSLFEALWHAGHELPTARARPDTETLDARDQTIIRLLASGAKDEAVARSLGVSVRTARRFIADLLDRLGASGRFEAGIAAAKRGWV